MDIQVKVAILAIIVVIPLSSYGVWMSDKPQFVEAHESSGIKVLTSFYPLYEFTKQIADEKIDVSLLTPGNIEPHDWDPTISDIERIQQADALVINGVGFENWIDKIDLINSGVLVIDSSQGIELLSSTMDKREEEHYEDHSYGDPHIWLNPILAKNQVENIEQGLIKLDPKNTEYYSKNAKTFKLKLDTLDSKIKTELAPCKKDFIAFHDSFSYFANQYGLTQHTITNTNDPSTPSPKTLEEIIILSQEFGINIVFTEEGVNTRTSSVIANEFGGKVMTLSPLEISTDDKDYIEKMEQNLSNLKEALCK